MTVVRRWAIALGVAALVLVVAFVATGIVGFLGFAFLVQSGAP
jgi:hypothetical protein